MEHMTGKKTDFSARRADLPGRNPLPSCPAYALHPPHVRKNPDKPKNARGINRLG